MTDVPSSYLVGASVSARQVIQCHKTPDAGIAVLCTAWRNSLPSDCSSLHMKAQNLDSLLCAEVMGEEFRLG